MRCLVTFSLLFLFIAPSAGQEAGAPLVMTPGPKSPEESLRCIKTRPGFKVELMAAEPLVQDPIAFNWGADGKLWVVEMGDYPLGAGAKGKPGGRVKFLTRSKADGPYDQATLFLDNLGYPNGVLPYGKGVLVTCAPDIFYAEDTDGDGKADKKEVLYTGFREGNPQHRVNGLVWGLDNWIYGANGDSGGGVKSLKTGQTLDIRGRDFRIQPATGALEAQSGQTQFGRARDDWGNWFGNNNSNPLFHYVLDDHYLRRNPHVLYPDPKVQVSVPPGAAAIYPISKTLPRFNSPQAVNHFTSACSAIIYRDELFGPAFANNTFVSEPVHNLIHREVMRPKGVTFTSQRAPDEQTAEFLASADNWFRPTTIQTGPDGALWVADMYRYVIEHPEWIPKDWQQKLDLRAGHDLGRIYRIYPVDKKPRALQRLDKMNVKELVACLESPNGWTRDTAQQLLISKGQAATAALVRLHNESANPVARIHAMYALQATQGGAEIDLRRALQSAHPMVRKHALRLGERRDAVRATSDLFAPLLNDPDPQVRMQLGYSLGTLANVDAAKSLAKLLCQEQDRYILAAALSSVNKANWGDISAALLQEKTIPVHVLTLLLPSAKAFGDAKELSRLTLLPLLAQEGKSGGEHLQQLVDILDTLERAKTSFNSLLASQEDAFARTIAERMRRLTQTARTLAVDRNALVAERIQAARLLHRGLGDDKEDVRLLAALLTPQTPDDLQTAAIQSLVRGHDARVPSLLLKAWPSSSPALRGIVLDAFLNNVPWSRQLVAALERKEVPASEIDAIRRQRLLQHKDAGIRQAATQLFAAASDPERSALVTDYWLKLPEKADAGRGAKLFTKACATCHKLGNLGQAVGPDLASVGDKTPQGLLAAILDPNRAVETRYINYVAATKNGLTLTGMLQSETSTSITLISSDGKSHQLLRNELEELVSTGKSLMPEGMEKDLSPQDLADVIAFVRAGTHR
jgi:putative membrane-bound dehydrogenase-like protein